MKRTISILLCVVLALACFASCGKKDSSDTSTTTKAKKTVKLVDIDLTEEEYAFGIDKNQADLLKKTNEYIAKIKDDGTYAEILNHYFGDGKPVGIKSKAEDSTKEQLVVATNAAFEPFEYVEGDVYYGIDMEIAKGLADYLGVELVIKNMDFDAVCLTVGQHKCDIAMAGLTVKPEREEYVVFTDSYYTASQKIVAMSDDTTFDNCKTAEDVVKILNSFDSKTKFGFQTGTTSQLYIEGDEEMEFPGLKVTGVGYKNSSLAVQSMINGNIKYCMIDAAPAACIVESVNELA